MVTIIFEPHATTTDNEAHLASGWNDVHLSETGAKQAKELGERRRPSDFDAIITSDLDRAYQTAHLAFGGIEPTKLYVDWRIRECDYGELTQRPTEEVDALKPGQISIPFSGGESYEQAAQRMCSFLRDLLRFYDGKTVLIIGHRATQYGLEHWINGIPLKEAITTPWAWQPGWTYELKEVRRSESTSSNEQR
jgi:broad specificity phosphatase PhoE